MTFDEIHALLLSDEFELVPDLLETGIGCSYFLKEINKAPATTTRIVRVHHDTNRMVSQIKLSVSSDRKNLVVIPQPYSRESLRVAITNEIALFRSEQQNSQA
jgi:hypothetical protein